MIKKTSLFFLLIIFHFTLFADFDKEAFLKKFNQLDYKEKVKLVANIDFNDIHDILPQIKDTLDRIKKYVYTSTNSNEAKFLFDLIEAKIAMQQLHFSKCINITNNCLQYHCDNINDSLKALILLKECLIKISDFSKALEVHKIIEKNWNRKTIGLWIGTPKSSLYSYLGIYKYAIAERVKEYEQSSHDHWETARLYNDIGVFFNRMQNFDSAEIYFSKALIELTKVNKKEHDPNYYDFFTTLIKSNMAVGLIAKKRYKEAIPYLQLDIKYSIKNKEYESAFNAYLGLIEIYINLNQTTLAKRYLDSLDKLDYPSFNYPKNLAKKYYWKSVYYEKTGELEKSLHFLKQYVKLNDSIKELEKEQQTINAEIAYNAHEKESALKEKNLAIQILKLEQEKYSTIKTYLIIFIIILIISGFILLKFYKQTKKHSEDLEKNNATIQQQNQIIQKSLEEKEMLIKEIHHRVKNNLQIITSIIRLQMAKENNIKNQETLNEIASRIQSIALTHQMLYKKDNFLTLNASEYIKQLCNQLVSTFSDFSNITIEYQIDDSENIELSLDNAIPLGLICSEVITNAVKYAFPEKKGKIEVIFQRIQNEIQLIVKDNGIGIDLNKTKNTDSLGMELIKLLSEQINADYQFIVNNGTTFQLSLKN